MPTYSGSFQVLKCLEELIEPEVPSSANCSAHLNYNLPIVSVRRRRYKQESEMYEFNEEISEEVETAQHSPEIEIEKETVKKRKISIVQLD